ncbi:MAG: NHL repeat-containing protein [Chloroflexota bacterium]
MAIESPAVRESATATFPYALLRAGYPYYTTLGMRRVTTACMDMALDSKRQLFVICRDDGQGGLIRRTNWDDEDLGTISGAGTEPGKLMWPVQIVCDSADVLYVSDEGANRISMFKTDGTFLGVWGEAGTGEGQLNRPSGIALDADENLWVVDTQNHRVQKFTKDGKFLSSFGSQGSADGQLDQPWGIAIDKAGDIYIGDWGNNRVQKFSPDGTHLLSMGREGSGDGELKRPAGVAVDAHGDIYVADRGNHRVCLFDQTGRYVEKFIGDATLSNSGRKYIMANPKVLRGREMTTLEIQKRFRGPASVRIEGDLMYVPDFGSHRIQVYKKEAYVLTEEDIWPEQNHPFLYNV